MVYVPTFREWKATQKGLFFQEKCGIFSCRNVDVRMEKAVENKIISRIYGNGRGWAFSQADFADLGTRSTIDSALHRRENEGVVAEKPRVWIAKMGTVVYGWDLAPDGRRALVLSQERSAEGLKREHELVFLD